MNRKVIIETKDLNKKYGENHILRNMDVSIYEKDFTIIMGNSGSGKSTLLYCMSGMDKITSGKILFLERNIVNLSEDDLALIRRREMSFIFQQMNLMPNLSILENVLLPSYILNEEKQDRLLAQAKEVLKDVGIEELINRMPKQVSGGQLQRAAIARALINNPKIIFADEPTGALNSKAGKAVLDILSNCHMRGQSILMVTHDLRAALRGNRIIYLSDGYIKGEINLVPFKNEQNLINREQQLLGWLQEMGW